MIRELKPRYFDPEREATGIAGLDEILGGGFPKGRMYLVEGDPGTGKTTLALQFLLEGARKGEPGVYVALSETEAELRAVAASHGWSLDGITICDLQSSQESLEADSQYTLFHPDEIELSDTTKAVLKVVEQVNPKRVAFDSLSEMRLLARDPLRYRRQVLALKTYFTQRDATVILLDYESTPTGDRQLHSLTHGVVVLEQLAPEYGGERRRLRIQKLRGVKFRNGYHDFTVETGGLVVYPRLVAGDHHHTAFEHGAAVSGVPALDDLLGGGLDAGTSTLIMGPAGVGKSTLAAQYAVAAVSRGERAAFYVFDEVPDTFTLRGEGLGMNMRDLAASGLIEIRQVDPAEMSPGEFAHLVKAQVEAGVKMVVIDSLNGYQSAMPEEHFLSAHLHELLAYMNQQGVVTVLVMAQHGILGEGVEAPIEISYLADTVILLRYFEMAGEVRKAISVVKKRTGRHERTIRELTMGPGGLSVGAPLRTFRGVLSGNLTWVGEEAPPADGNGSGPG